MNFKKLRKSITLIVPVFIVLGAPTMLHAQSIGPSTIDAAGGSATIGGTTHEYAIGQWTSGESYISSGLVVTPNVLQPTASTGIASYGSAIDGLRVYPSPVEKTLFIQPAFANGGMLHYTLVDEAGKKVGDGETKLISGKERQDIDVSAIAVGQYILNIQWQSGSSQTASSYKVQKLR